MLDLLILFCCYDQLIILLVGWLIAFVCLFVCQSVRGFFLLVGCIVHHSNILLAGWLVIFIVGCLANFI